MCLKLKNLSYTINGNLIFKNVNLELSKPGMYGLMGRNGSGKSTLCDLISLKRKKFGGTITFDDWNINQDSLNYYKDKICQRISYVEVKELLFDNLTVMENLYLCTKDTNKINEYLNKMDIYEIKELLASDISKGEAMRVYFLMNVLQDNQIILLDEINSNLDYKTVELVFDFLLELSKSKIIIFVSNDMNIINKYAEFVLKVENKTIVGDVISNTTNIKTDYKNDNEKLESNKSFKKILFSVKKSYLMALLIFTIAIGLLSVFYYNTFQKQAIYDSIIKENIGSTFLIRRNDTIIKGTSFPLRNKSLYNNESYYNNFSEYMIADQPFIKNIFNIKSFGPPLIKAPIITNEFIMYNNIYEVSDGMIGISKLEYDKLLEYDYIIQKDGKLYINYLGKKFDECEKQFEILIYQPPFDLPFTFITYNTYIDYILFLNNIGKLSINSPVNIKDKFVGSYKIIISTDLKENNVILPEIFSSFSNEDNKLELSFYQDYYNYYDINVNVSSYNDQNNIIISQDLFFDLIDKSYALIARDNIGVEITNDNWEEVTYTLIQYDAIIITPFYEDHANLLLFAKTYNYVFVAIIFIMSILYLIILYFYLILFFKNNQKNIYLFKDLNYSRKVIYKYIFKKYIIFFSTCFLVTGIIFIVIKQLILERYFNVFYNVSIISDSKIEYIAYSFFLYIITLLMLFIFSKHYVKKGNYHD